MKVYSREAAVLHSGKKHNTILPNSHAIKLLYFMGITPRNTLPPITPQASHRS